LSPCMHHFCIECATKWVNEKFTCPLCRELCEITETKYIFGADPNLFRTMKLIGVY